MKERNVYRDFVLIAAVLLVFIYAKGRVKLWAREQKTYGFVIQSQQELTGSIAGEFAKILGLTQFLPSSSVTVTLKLEEYTLETELDGVYLEEYPLQWEAAKEKAVLSNTAALFLGKESFAAFTDKSGHGPAKSRIAEWTTHYDELSVMVLDETGQERKAKVFGILKEPEGIVCMDKRQMEEVFGDVCQVRGGYMQVHGYRNAKAAKKALEQAGFLVEEMS